MTVSTNDSFACWATGSISALGATNAVVGATSALIKTANDTLVVR